MAMDSAATFAARVRDLGLGELLPRFLELGWVNMGTLAFSAGTPGAPSSEVAFDERVGYFDLCGFMGGEGSMVEWVNKSPPLAGPDHIHFTRRGAKKVGVAIANAIKQELNRYE